MKNKQIVYGTVINYATVFVQMISTVVVTPYLIKMFGDNDYGIYKIIVALAAYLIILNFGVGNTLIRFLSELRAKGEDKGDAAKALVSFSTALNFVAGLFAVLVGCLIFRFIPNFFSPISRVGRFPFFFLLLVYYPPKFSFPLICFPV